MSCSLPMPATLSLPLFCAVQVLPTKGETNRQAEEQKRVVYGYKYEKKRN